MRTHKDGDYWQQQLAKVDSDIGELENTLKRMSTELQRKKDERVRLQQYYKATKPIPHDMLSKLETTERDFVRKQLEDILRTEVNTRASATMAKDAVLERLTQLRLNCKDSIRALFDQMLADLQHEQTRFAR